MVGWIGFPRAQVTGPNAFSETCGSWAVRCTDGPARENGGDPRCAMEQRFARRDPESGRRRPLLTVTPLPADEGMEAVVLTRFGLLFENGLRADRIQARGSSTQNPDSSLGIRPGIVQASQRSRTVVPAAEGISNSSSLDSRSLMSCSPASPCPFPSSMHRVSVSTHAAANGWRMEMSAR